MNIRILNEKAMLAEKDGCGCESITALSLSSVRTTTSSPGASGPSISGIVQITLPAFSNEPEIEHPICSKTKPFPQQETSCEKSSRHSVDIEQHQSFRMARGEICLAERALSSRMTFCDLPIEIHELILDHVFGARGSTANTPTSSRGWNTTLRHSRRRHLSDLALVNRRYRNLVQGRLYKHIKIQGTRPSVENALLFFTSHPHLQKFPRHVEIWSPVWERRAGLLGGQVLIPPTTPERITLVPAVQGSTGGLETSSNVTSAYQLSSRNSSLYEIFQLIHMVFPRACILTLEGGHCKKPPKVRHFPEGESMLHSLPKLPSIRTLILKSAWNIMRTEEDFEVIMAALPKLREWNSSYAKPKSKSYISEN
ncbi:MAG: hypothetical protein M1818_002925 [Claussenomyces sp. TS43310]|nr:MAG: hypothetical protein M1818_002925 [Claussenomyces sp. TS43310]